MPAGAETAREKLLPGHFARYYFTTHLRLMKKQLPLILILLTLNSHAEEITWTATGTVSSVSGSGFTAGIGSQVSVKASYQTGLAVSTIQYIPIGGSIFKKTEFTGNIGLKIEVTIGTSTWSGEVPSSPAGGTTPLLTDAWDGNGPSDIFTITASSLDSGTFSPFPYTGSATARSIAITLADNTTPGQFIQAGELPMDWSEPLQLTQATGVIQAGTDRINFTLAPNSVKVSSDAPRIPLTSNRTPNGLELRWTGVGGVALSGAGV